MEEDYIDEESGWHVTRRPADEGSGDIVILTSPETGERREILVSAGFGLFNVAEYLAETEEDREADRARRNQAEAWIRERYPETAGGREVPDGPLGRIKLEFARMYAFCRLSLPDDAVASRAPGTLPNRIGLYLEYRFGRDECGEFIEFFAAHRMTNDRLYRIRENGRVELIDASLDMLAGVDEETRATERRFYRTVREHGFLKEK